MSFGRLIRTIGLILLLCSAVWWVSFFGRVAKLSGSPDILGQASTCLLYTTSPCAIAYNIAELAGQMAYRPFLTWVGLGLYVVGLFVSVSRRTRWR
jgi:hypothetical protein